jgi:hypothetical protein
MLRRELGYAGFKRADQPAQSGAGAQAETRWPGEELTKRTAHDFRPLEVHPARNDAEFPAQILRGRTVY